ncbi:MAG: membrane protein insertase YidC [Candidatus Binatia bacterium]
MEERALLAFVLSVAILIGYQYLASSRGEFAPAPTPPAGVEKPSEGGPVPEPSGEDFGLEEDGFLAEPLGDAASVEMPADAEETTLSVVTDLYIAEFTSFGGRIRSFLLKDYKLNGGDGSRQLDMVHSDSALPLAVYWTDPEGRPLSDRGIAYEFELRGGEVVHAADRATLTMTGTGPGGERIIKKIGFHGGSYTLDLDVSVSARGSRSVGVAWSRAVGTGGNRFAGKDGPVVFVDGGLEAESAASLEEPVVQAGQTSWAGYASHYFLAAFYPASAELLRFVARVSGQTGECVLWKDGAESVSYQLFVGPKRLGMLKALGHDLDEAVDLGWFAAIARPMLQMLIFLNRYTGNYGVAIILLTIGVKVVFYPVNKKQALAMKAMQRVQPELKKLQERYKDDRETLNKEMMELYRRHMVNPLSGCLPMIIQIPVFLGLYNALMQAIELRHSPFFGWITDLSQPDRLGTLALPFVSPPGIPVMTLLMGLSMLLQQRMTPSMGDPAQQKMMMLMPIIFTVMFVNFPSGLVIYWLANNLLSIGQQYFTNRVRTQE